jgi:hypothetical protein
MYQEESILDVHQEEPILEPISLLFKIFGTMKFSAVVIKILSEHDFHQLRNCIDTGHLYNKF